MELRHKGGLILASTSKTRRLMLSSAGLTFEVMDAQVDESAERTALKAVGPKTPLQTAAHLASVKACMVSARHPQAVVIGADQILELHDNMLHKASTIEEARTALQALRGQWHALHSAVALAEGGQCVWSALDTARLKMRDFSDAYLNDYLDMAGEDVLASVGCYKIEGMGVQLFERIEGAHSTILGLPLLPLLAQLRNRQVIPA